MRSTNQENDRRDDHSGSDVILTKPVPLTGTAEIIRSWYLQAGLMTKNQSLYICDPYTGEEDLACGERPRKKHSRSKIAKARNAARRKKYRESREFQQSG